MGRFSGNPATEWLPDGRNMRLIGQLWYIDDDGVSWIATSGEVIDGASIPRIAWRLIGSPFSGKYRRASVLHDVYYVKRTRPRKEVDQMFLQAMRDDGVSAWRRHLMYWAVRCCGPRFDVMDSEHA